MDNRIEAQLATLMTNKAAEDVGVLGSIEGSSVIKEGKRRQAACRGSRRLRPFTKLDPSGAAEKPTVDGATVRFDSVTSAEMKYYDPTKNWRKIQPHLSDPELNEILVRDFNKYTFGRFLPGMFPRDFESCDWDRERRGKRSRYHAYVKHAACHWLVGFNLRLAMLVEAKRPWRIVTSREHSTVWDGGCLLFDFNALALGISPDKAFELARTGGRELKPGKHIKLYFADHYSKE